MPSPQVTQIVANAQRLFERVARRLLPSRANTAEGDRQRWLVVTVEGDPTQITPGGLPGPLAELGQTVEVEVRPAPGSWGMEIFARPAAVPSPTVADPDLRGRIRSALRQTKQLLEVGEVLVAEPRPEGRRPATVGGKLVDYAVLNADEKGVL